MNGLGSGLLVYTFYTESLTGSPQHLHFFNDQDQMKSVFHKFQVSDERDHSFISFENKKRANVLWKNKAGPIQFCGSGAYALSWISSELYQKNELEIVSGTSTYYSYHANNLTFLDFSSTLPMQINDLDLNKLYLAGDSGVFLLQLSDIEQLKNDELVKSYLKLLEQEYSDNIHGLCVFVWKQSAGYLRYFTPWHGRDEDYVTGSIHQYLTPLVHNIYGANKQNWQQYSRLGGKLQSIYSNQKVTLTGKCKVDKKTIKYF